MSSSTTRFSTNRPQYWWITTKVRLKCIELSWWVCQGLHMIEVGAAIITSYIMLYAKTRLSWTLTWKKCLWIWRTIVLMSDQRLPLYQKLVFIGLIWFWTLTNYTNCRISLWQGQMKNKILLNSIKDWVTSDSVDKLRALRLMEASNCSSSED